MPDLANRETDKILEQTEKKIAQIYNRAQKEVDKKTEAYFKASEKRDVAQKKRLADGKITQEQYDNWRKGQLFMGEQYKQMQKQVSEEMLNASRTAAAYVNGKMPEVYALGYNAFDEDIGALKGYSFNLVDAATVRSLAMEDKTLLPYKTVNGKKEERWATQKVNSEILQGVIQGESVSKIAKRLRNVTDMDKNASIRNARTSMTSAENKGRMDSYEEATNMGIVLKKVWICSHDGKTRDAHLELNGVEQDYDKEFENSLGAIMYPGDPNAEPANVYNCRCTMISKIIKFEDKRQKSAIPDFYEMGEQEYLDWQEKNSTRGVIEKEFEKKYGIPIEDAWRKDYWVENERKWLYQISEEYQEDLWQVSGGQGHCGYIQSSDGSKAINAYLRRDEVGIYSKKEMQKTIDAMDRLIDSTPLKEDLWVDRCAGIDAIERMGIPVGEHGASFRIGHAFCTDGVDFEKVALKINKDYIGAVLVDNGFMSASACPTTNIFGGSDVTFTIMAPKGTKAFISDNTRESELVFSHGTKQEILGSRVTEREAVDYDGKKTKRKTLEIFLKIIE